MKPLPELFWSQFRVFGVLEHPRSIQFGLREVCHILREVGFPVRSGPWALGFRIAPEDRGWIDEQALSLEAKAGPS